ncbi:MAG: hypothetical protein F6K19_23085 [Cyanothece sp. SIO1E1]|nr:hypothetical protein [Cyanothece sp. SIO1E1]
MNTLVNHSIKNAFFLVIGLQMISSSPLFSQSQGEDLSYVQKNDFLDYDEESLLPGNSIIEQLAFVSQLDKLEETTTDYARCSAAATLSAYLLLGGDFAEIASKYDIEPTLTFGNVHRVQEVLYHEANVDGQPGIYGTARPKYDSDGNLTGWYVREGDEYHTVVEALGLEMTRIFSPYESEPLNKRPAIEELLSNPGDEVFIVGVNEDMEQEKFYPMEEGVGNHYVIMFRHGDHFYALDSYRTPGRNALVALNEEEVNAHLYYTHNAIYALKWKQEGK